VRAAAVVIGAARAHGETESHRLEGARFVSGNLQSLDLGCERDAAMADRLCGALAAFGQEVAQALARADELDGPMHGGAVAKSQPGRVEPSVLRALHGECDCAAGADRVDAELVTQARRAQHCVRVGDSAQRAEGEQALVLEPYAVPAAERVDVLAANRA